MSSFPASPTDVLFPPQTKAAEATGTSTLEEEVLALFDSLHGSLLRYAVSFGLSTHDAEDIIQEVFLALFHHLRRGRSRSNLRGWVFRVTHNLALKRRARLSVENKLIDVAVTSPEDYLYLDPAPDPEALLLFDERQTHLLAVFHALPKKDQWCLRLRAEGLRYREISRVVQISLGSVSASLTRSLARLASLDKR